jgi:esterase/lipase
LADLANLDAALAAQEAQVPNLRAGCEKRIVWASEAGVKTPTSVVFIHGFSATSEELRPLPDLVAQGLGANLFFTRLDGHGQDGPAMGRATLEAWMADVAEALDVAHTIGDEVIVIGCSTGCTLATLAFAQGDMAKAMVHVSPNFGLRHRAVQSLLDMPGSRHWSKYIAGSLRSFSPKNAGHDAYWTLSYPTAAVHVMADTVRAARQADLSEIRTPALFCFNEADQVVHPKDTRRVMHQWGAPVQEIKIIQSSDDDDMGHIMAGDVMSPGQTEPLAKRILAWLNALPTS